MDPRAVEDLQDTATSPIYCLHGDSTPMSTETAESSQRPGLLQEITKVCSVTMCTIVTNKQYNLLCNMQ